MYHFFYQTNSPFSNFHPAPYTHNGIKFPTSEHGMMYEKATFFGDTNTAGKILLAKTPAAAKKLGRQVKPFDPVSWASNSVRLFLPHLVAKFTQNRKCKAALLATGDKKLVEASPRDRIWGIGYNSKDALDNIETWGENRLGTTLDQVKVIIRSTK